MNEGARRNNVTKASIGVVINVHRLLGSRLLKSAYEACMAYGLTQAGLKVEQRKTFSCSVSRCSICIRVIAWI
ncbi:conserved hypothetical protein [Candidatus Brocadia pituitae]|nr:conserved hypothetical protein [Candidatus Brocadia pituitae]